jgi:hypothetical protein
MSQFARFIRPGFVRVNTSRPPTGTYVTAYKNSSGIVIVAINNTSAPREQTFLLEGATVPKFIPYLTSETKNCIQESDLLVTDYSFTDTLEPMSITTYVSDGPVGVEVYTPFPGEFHLSQNYPNPFNPTTQIKYSIPESEYVSLKLYNVLGEAAAVLFEGFKQAGSYVVSFDGSGFSGGVYFYRLQAGNFNQTRKFILLK